MMKKIFVSGLMIIVIGLVGSIASFAIKNPFETVPIDKKKAVDANGINQIQIISSSTDVHIAPSKKKEITAELTGKMKKKIKDYYNLSVNKQNGRVIIQLKRKDSFHLNIMEYGKTKLSIKIPENTYQTLLVETSSGDISARGIVATQLALKSSSGDIDVEDGLATGDLSIESSSGDINVNGQKSKQISISSSSGSINLNEIEGNILTKTRSGDIHITPSDKIEGISAETSSGDVLVQTKQRRIPFAINFKGNSGDGKVNVEGAQYTVKSEHAVVGNIAIGTVKLKVRTSSGDFTLK